MELGLNGKIAVITGGSKGIGFATARAFLREGAKVAICARDDAGLKAAAADLSRFGEVFATPLDMTCPEAALALADAACERFGGIDCWVNNVGASIPRSGEGYSQSDIDNTARVCFHSAVYGCQAAFKHMRKRGGAIVNVSSLAARCGSAGRATLYGPLKAAVRDLAVMFAAEYAAFGVRVNSVLPGFTLTPAVARTISKDELDKNIAGTLLRRAATPEEIAGPIVFLCGAPASFITAASLEASGGRSVVLNPEYSYAARERGHV